MTERQHRVLMALIQEYIRTAEPVGSELLVERYRLPYSPATVRGELADLEDTGYLMHPYTSAGRMPTSRGYRFYVDSHAVVHSLSHNERSLLQEHLLQGNGRDHRLARRTAKLLALLTGSLAVAGLAETEEIQEAGLSELLEAPEFSAADVIREVARVVDAVDVHLDELLRIPAHETRVFIGEENPYAEAARVSMLLTTCVLPSGDQGVLVVIGPTRMPYDRNLALLKRVSEFVEVASPGGSS